MLRSGGRSNIEAVVGDLGLLLSLLVFFALFARFVLLLFCGSGVVLLGRLGWVGMLPFDLDLVIVGFAICAQLVL